MPASALTSAIFSVLLRPMKYTHTYRPTVFRFRRWSRKGYAVFCSLGRLVTIGRGCKSIADASLRKSGTMLLPVCTAPGRSTLEDAECPPGSEDAISPSCPVAVCVFPVPVCECGAGAHRLLSQAVAGDTDDTYNHLTYTRRAKSADDAKIHISTGIIRALCVRTGAYRRVSEQTQIIWI